ncbi:MAG: hypothetical protein E4G94_00980 [ANME-2 cluster archaeon]|nr:MAG: hypothetical protein E4G94_00980 [ANME-2 cluster archaeon]
MDDIKQLIKNVSLFFRSRKLAIVLIILIIAVTILGTIIPQEHIYTHRHMEEMKEQNQYLIYMDMIGFTAIYTSWLFFGIMFLFLINTSFCTFNMSRNALKKLQSSGKFRGKDSIIKLDNNASVSCKNIRSANEKVIHILRKKRYKVKQDGSKIFAVKNRFGVLGTPLFHLCILLVISSIAYGGMSRMEGKLQLAEGQSLSEQHQEYFYVAEGPLFKEQHKNLVFRLEKFDPYFEDDKGIYRGAASKIAFVKDGLVVKRDVVHSNHLIVYDGITIFQNEYGFSPLFLLKNESGGVISGSYVYAEDDGSGRYLSVFPVAETGLTAQVTLYPNTSRGILEGGYDIPKDPMVYLELFKGQELVFDGVLGMNQMVVIGDIGSETVTFGFYDLKYWSIISIVNDKGIPYIFGGFYLSLFSIFVMFFFSPSQVWASLGQEDNGSTIIYIGGRSDRYKSSFKDEFNIIITQLEGEEMKNGSA